MLIKTVVVGDLQTNCYILIKDNKALVIDPGDEFDKIKNELNDYDVIGCYITHSHFDHIGALDELLKEYNLKLNNQKELVFDFEVIETPGHTDDSVTYYFKEDKIMFTGDFIFYRSIGRTDLGGNDKDMLDSLEIIKKYPDDIKIYPGHGLSTILGDEKKYFSYYY
ncbi:MAG: MBL fold metallo-hydrolase [Candidatus Coprovivens sp.]